MLIPLAQLFKKYKLIISGVIHVGAHYGEELIDYNKLNIPNIFLFEPLRENFQILQKEIIKYDKANIQSYCCALGNDEGERPIFLSSNNLESSSLLEPDQHLTDHPEVSFTGKQNVKLKKLDQFNIQNSNFLNMDVQGYELEVLKGGSKTLVNIDYIYCEINRASTYKNNALVDEIDSFLKKYDFKRYETVWAGVNLSWGDAFYIRKNKYRINKFFFIYTIFYNLYYKFKNILRYVIKKFYLILNFFI